METLFLFSLAVIALGLMPGPNVMVIVGLSVSQGIRVRLWAVLGTSVGLALQLGVVALGLSVVVQLLSELFWVLRWVGVAYLSYLAVRTLRDGFTKEGETVGDGALSSPLPYRTAFVSGLVVVLFNPKTLLFLGSFLPQFVLADHPLTPETQIYLLAGLYLLILAAVDCGWLLLSGWAQWFLGTGVTIGRTVRFGCLSIAALMLALVKR